jgi:antitoxin CptB
MSLGLSDNSRHDPTHPTFDARIRFRCRRGMLELDALLNRFYQKGYATLNHEEKTLFSQLLDEEDPDLQAWLVAGRDPSHAALSKLIVLIRESSHV